MANFQARALYDFRGEPNTAEMTITAGEVLTVTRTDVGEGWWEGLTSNGKSGLFPEAYVEKVSGGAVPGPPALPPPTLPPQNPVVDAWSGGDNRQSQDDGWDDDWDEDPYSEIPQNQEQLYANEPTNHKQYSSIANDGDTVSEMSFNATDKGTVTKKSLNRFSTFVKSGGESYILGTLKVAVDERYKIRIVKLDDFVFTWPPLSNLYTVQVTSPKKETKLKGLKTFIAYQLTPSISNIPVSRRYKHFDWLHERLSEKFSLIAVPPLPDKQISGRYEEQFVEHRRVQLQEFVDYVCRHPVLSGSDVWRHFITCTDEKQWKQGKRAAEKDQLIGANFCLSIEAPEKTLLPSQVDEKMDTNLNFIFNLDAAIKNLMTTAVDQTKKHHGTYNKEYTKIGESFYSLGTAIEYAEKAIPSDLATGIKHIGTAYIDIGRLFQEQLKFDWEPLSDKLYIYRGITGSFPEIFSIHKGAQQKKKECEKHMQIAQVNEVRKRTDTLTYAIFAELNHFKVERDADLRETMKKYLHEQINFYKKIVDKLEDTLKNFE